MALGSLCLRQRKRDCGRTALFRPQRHGEISCFGAADGVGAGPGAHARVGRMHARDFVAVLQVEGLAVEVADAPDDRGVCFFRGDVLGCGLACGYGDGVGCDEEFVLVELHCVAAGFH